MKIAAKYRGAAYARLRNVRPAGVAAIVDGEAVELSVKRGASKGKWERVLAAAEGMDAEALQLSDNDGGVLEIVELREPQPITDVLAPSDEDDAALQRKLLAQSVVQFEKLSAIMLDACDRAVQRQAEQMGQVLEASLSMMRTATERAERADKALEKVLRAQTLQLERNGGGAIQKASVMDDVMALLSAAKMSGFDVERFMGSISGNGDDDDDDDAIDPDEVIDKPRKAAPQ